MTKYKYYFRKPKSEIAKDILKVLLISGIVYIAAGSPYFALNLGKIIKGLKKHGDKKVYDTFYRLRKRGYVRTKINKGQIYISLTDKGKKMAGWLQIDRLKIKKPKKWDKKWRIVIFDIAELKKTHREAFRGKLKELGFKPLQKSVWIHPFTCKDEVDLLRDFFGLSEKDIRLIMAENIGEDKELKKIFKIVQT